MAKTLLALGTNLGDHNRNLDRAVELIDSRIGRIMVASSRRVTEPLLHPETPTAGQAAYSNMALVAETSLTGEQLLDTCQAIEREIGRVREREKVRWEPRIIDIDIIALDDVVLITPRLEIPHSQMHLRRFVLEPFAEIWPGWRHPRLRRTATELLSALPRDSSLPVVAVEHSTFMKRAVAVASEDLEAPNGRPFGAVVVRHGTIVGEGRNLINVQCDATAHAEIVAIRDACRRLSEPHINGSVLYCTAEPCPMCLAACYWAGITDVYFGLSSLDAAQYGFADLELYTELARLRDERSIRMVQVSNDAVTDLFTAFGRLHPYYRTSLLRQPASRRSKAP